MMTTERKGDQERRRSDRSAGRTNQSREREREREREKERNEREGAHRALSETSGGLMNEGKRRQRERGRNEKGSERGEETRGKENGRRGRERRGGAEGTRSEVSRDDAVVRLQGRRKEEPRREPVPVTGPPAGRRTRHTAPYRPLLSHSLPSPLYALRPPRHRCVTSLRTSRRLLATGATLHARARASALPSSSSNNVNSYPAYSPYALIMPSPLSLRLPPREHEPRAISRVPFSPSASAAIFCAQCLGVLRSLLWTTLFG